jgi:hypothetical protein
VSHENRADIMDCFLGEKMRTVCVAVLLPRFVALACLILNAKNGNAQTSGGSSPKTERQNSASIETLGVCAPKDEEALSVHSLGASFRVASDSSQSPAKYLLIGAAIGAVTLGVVTGVRLSHCTDSDSCGFAGPVVPLAIGAGAILGTLAGWIAYYDNQHEKK